MNRAYIPLLVAMLGVNCMDGRCLMTQTPGRPIRFSPDVPIANRLLPDDKEVFVYMETLPGYRTDGAPESFDQEIKRLRISEIIAVVRVETVDGELIEDGTWIGTKVNAKIEQLVQSPPGSTLDSSVEFAFSGGTTEINKVVVTAGTFWQFVQGERYLILLYPGIKGLSLSLAFRANPNELLEFVPLIDNQGCIVRFKTNLVGRNVSDVVEALTSVK